MMNCFEWQNRASDYLDGTLSESLQPRADAHLAACKACRERLTRFQILIKTLAQQPRSTLPFPIRKAPFATPLPRLNFARIGRTQWEMIPWWIRTTLEGTGIVFLILFGISVGPKLRMLYERNIERNLTEFNEAFSHPDSGTETIAGLNLPLTRGKTAAPHAETDATSASGAATVIADEFATSEDDSVEDESADGGSGSGSGSIASGDASSSADSTNDIRVGNSEIWRFNLKTDSPHEFRPKVVQLLAELKIPATTPGLGGIEAPGGIQFDLLLSQSVVPALKKHLQKLAPPTPEGLSGSPAGETFTWYKNRSRNEIPTGHTKVVIWLSQM